MKITFLLSTFGLNGGVKVVFEYANRFVALGHQVEVVSPLVLLKRSSIKDCFRAVLKRVLDLFRAIFNCRQTSWFPLDKRVIVSRPFNLAFKNLNQTDIVIATANETVDWLVDYPIAENKKFYFIQDYETWSRSIVEVDKTWQTSFKKIVISLWLQRLAQDKFNQPSELVMNGIDLTVFNNQQPKQYNDQVKVLLMYHFLPKKGFANGLAAFNLAKLKNPNLTLTVFGAEHIANYTLPEGVKYYYRPQQQELANLYRTADIFLWPSLIEGFGLPPMEAMACRCAVISTDTGAIRELSDNGRTAIIVPPNNVETMAKALLDLSLNCQKLSQLSSDSYLNIQKFNWDEAVKKFLTIISG